MTVKAPNATALYNEFAIPAFDEAAFLYHQRRHKSARRLGLFGEIVELDQRLKNNLDHLGYFYDAAKFLSEERLDLLDDADAFVGIFLGIYFEDSIWVQKILSTYLDHEDGSQAIATALAWMPLSKRASWLSKLLSSKNPSYQYVALYACSLLGDYPRESIDSLINQHDYKAHLPLHRILLQVVAQFKCGEHLNWVNESIQHKNPLIRNCACRASLLIGDGRSLDVAMRQSLTDNESFQLLAPHIIRFQDNHRKHSWFAQAINTKEIALDLRILAVGDYGDSRGVAWLLQYMDHPTYAPIAAYAFRQITGANLEYFGLIQTVDELASMKTEENGAQDTVDERFLDEDTSLAIPAKTRSQKFWLEYQKNFAPGQRYILGRQHLPENPDYLAFMEALQNAEVLGDRILARQELAHLTNACTSSSFIASQYG